MQPFTSQGRKLRLALMPISYFIAFATIYIMLICLAKIENSSIKGLLQTDNLWPLAIILPCFTFGKILGLMAINGIAYLIPHLRHAFENEVAETGRNNFFQAMKGLSIALAISLIITVLGAILFLQYK